MRIFFTHLLYLLRQFPRRRQNQRDRSLAPMYRLLIANMHNRRQNIRQRFPRPRLRNTNHILAAHRNRPPLRLYRRRCIVTQFHNLTHNVRGEIRLLELLHRFRYIRTGHGDLFEFLILFNFERAAIRHVRVGRIKILLERFKIAIERGFLLRGLIETRERLTGCLGGVFVVIAIAEWFAIVAVAVAVGVAVIVSTFERPLNNSFTF